MRLKMIFSYDGHAFNGYQRLKIKRTVQGEIEGVLSKIFNCETKIVSSGRTDINVHALNQVAHFDVNKTNLDCDKLRYSLNCLLPNDIHVNELAIVSNRFHARANAYKKKYRYILNMGEANPFFENYRYELKRHLDIEKMKNQLPIIIGEHDFKNFTTKEEDKQNFIRKIYSCKILTKKDIVTFEIVGSGFMRHMVRMLVGALVAIGLGKEKEDYIKNTLSCDRHPINHKVPGCGLYLIKVYYKEGNK